jgi:hypothetical protein
LGGNDIPQVCEVDTTVVDCLVQRAVSAPMLWCQRQPYQRADRALSAQHRVCQLEQRIRPSRKSARIEVYPAATPETELPAGRFIDKKHTRVVISWP